MDITQLTPEQHAKLKAQTEAMLDYLHRLLGRLDDRRFKRDGEFFQAVLGAMRGVHSLWEYIEFHKPANGPEDGGLPF